MAGGMEENRNCRECVDEKGRQLNGREGVASIRGGRGALGAELWGGNCTDVGGNVDLGVTHRGGSPRCWRGDNI